MMQVATLVDGLRRLAPRMRPTRLGGLGFTLRTMSHGLAAPPARMVRLDGLPYILTPAEVCGVLRKDVHKPCKAVRALERGGLRVLTVGRDLRVMRVDLEEFLAAIPK